MKALSPWTRLNLLVMITMMTMRLSPMFDERWNLRKREYDRRNEKLSFKKQEREKGKGCFDRSRRGKTASMMGTMGMSPKRRNVC